MIVGDDDPGRGHGAICRGSTATTQESPVVTAVDRAGAAEFGRAPAAMAKRPTPVPALVAVGGVADVAVVANSTSSRKLRVVDGE